LSDDLDDVTEVVLSGNNAEWVAGDVRIICESGEIVSDRSGSSRTITLKPKEGVYFETGKEYYIVCMPTTFSKGISLKINRASGGWYCRQTSASYTLARNKLVNLGLQQSKFFPSVYKDKYSEAEGVGIILGLDGISGITWAPFNVGGYDALSLPIDLSGILGSKKASVNGLMRYEYNGDQVATTVCPDGWRLPTYEEAAAFSGTESASKTYFEWGQSGEVSGCFVYDNTEKTGKHLFFPACGLFSKRIYHSGGVASFVWCVSSEEGKYGVIEMGSSFDDPEEQMETVPEGIKVDKIQSSDECYRSVRCVHD